jgi:hypothetical protein
MENLNEPLPAYRDEAFLGPADALRLLKEKIVFGREVLSPAFAKSRTSKEKS